MSIMTWAKFSERYKRISLHIMQKNADAAKRTYSVNSYIKTLEKRHQDLYGLDLIFMQDNSLICIGEKVEK